MRYFLAIPLPEDIKQKLHEINSKLQEFKGLRFVSPDNMHLTLLFLGDNGAKQKIEELKKIKFEPFTLKINKITIHPDNKKMRLIWAELEESKELIALQKKITQLFEIKQEYKPHITLARIKTTKYFKKEELIKKINEINTPRTKINVKNYKLYSSELTVLGPVHRVIEYFEAK